MDYFPWLRNFSLDACVVPNHPAMGLHGHGTYWELVLIISGTGQHLLKDHSFPLETGDIFVLPPHLKHGYADCQALTIMNVVYDPERLALPEHQLRQVPGYTSLFSQAPKRGAGGRFQSRLRVTPEVLAEFLATLTRLKSEVSTGKPGFEIVGTGLFCSFIVELARSYSAVRSPASQTALHLTGVLQWVEKHLDHSISIDELAERAGMSRRNLERNFREIFGLSPLGYVLQLRIRKAEYLLRETDLRVSEVAVRTGIGDASYFARIFRKYTNLEPKAYRAQYRLETGLRLA